MFDQVPEGESADAASSAAGRVRWEAEPTGPATIAALAGLSLAGLPSAELLDLVTAWDRQAGWLAAQQNRVIAAAAARIRAEADADYGDPETSENLVAAEIGTALRLSPNTAARRVHVAYDLTRLLPATMQALSEGRISYWQASAIATGTAGLTDEQARLVEDRVLPGAASTTVAGLKKRIERARLVLNPRDTSERAREAVENRTVTFTPGEDGMAELQAYGPAPQLQAVFHALDTVAGRAPKSDGRRIGARRFDALVDAVLGTSDRPGCPPPTRVKATVHVTMDLATLLGLADHPGELHGYGPLPAPLARMLAADNEWRRLVHDPVSGAPLDLGTLKRKPSAEIVRWVRARDAICLFPGCFHAATCCDLDHRIRVVDHGPTNVQNLAPLCPKHHRVKEHGWRYARYPDRIVWTSPAGRTYTRYLHEAHHDLIALLDAGGPDLEPAEFDEVAHLGNFATGNQRPDPEPKPPRVRRPPDPPDRDENGPISPGNIPRPDLDDIQANGPPDDIDVDTLSPPADLGMLLRPHALSELTRFERTELVDDEDTDLFEGSVLLEDTEFVEESELSDDPVLRLERRS